MVLGRPEPEYGRERKSAPAAGGGQPKKLTPLLSQARDSPTYFFSSPVESPTEAETLLISANCFCASSMSEG